MFEEHCPVELVALSFVVAAEPQSNVVFKTKVQKQICVGNVDNALCILSRCKVRQPKVPKDIPEWDQRCQECLIPLHRRYLPISSLVVSCINFSFSVLYEGAPVLDLGQNCRMELFYIIY